MAISIKYIEFGSGINISGELFAPLQKGQSRQFSAITISGTFSDIVKDQPLSVKNLWGEAVSTVKMIEF